MSRADRMIVKRQFGSAGLFAGLAIVALSFAVSAPSYSGVLYGPTTAATSLLSPRSLLFSITLAGALSALIYWMLAQSTSSSLNRSLIIAHFVLLAAALLIAVEALRSWAAVLSYASHAKSTTYVIWHSPVVQVGFVVVALDCIIFLVNLSMVAIQRSR